VNYEIIGQKINGDVEFNQHLIELLEGDFIECKCLIAFMTLNGLLKIGVGSEGALNKFIKRKNTRLQWIIGIDQITTPEALDILRNSISPYSKRHSIWAFKSPPGHLFHPKVYMFITSEMTGTVLIGSNNITPGGLSNNYEVSVRLNDLSPISIKRWNKLWNRTLLFKNLLFEIDDDLLSEVRNRRIFEIKNRIMTKPSIPDIEVEMPIESPIILIREVPRASGRVSQVHFTKDIIENYFHLRLGSSMHLKFQEFRYSHITEIEERPLVYSEINKNPKIELEGAKTLIDSYPEDDEDRPLLIFERIEKNFYRYMLLLPDDDGFTELSEFLSINYRRGRASLKFNFINIETMLKVWPGYPM